MVIGFIGNAIADAKSDSLRLIWNNTSAPDSSRFKALNDFAMEGVFTYPDTVLTVTEYHFELASLKENKLEISNAIENKAFAYSMLGNYNQALIEMEKVLVIAKELGNEKQLAANYSNIGTVYYYQSKFQEAIRYFTKSVAIYEDKAMLAQKAEVVNNLGLIYYEINSWDKALAYFNETLALYRQLGKENNMGNIWLNIGSVHLKKEANTLAIDYGQKALSILKNTNNLVASSDCYFLFSRAYQNLNQLDSARYYAQRSLDINIEIGNTEKILADKILLATLDFENNVKKATNLGVEILPAALSLSNNSIKVNIYDLLYKCYKKQGRYDEALEMHENYLTFYDSLLVEESHTAVIQEAIKSEYEIKLVKNQLENEQFQADLKYKQLKRTYTIITCGLLLIFLILYYTWTKINSHRKQERELLEQIEQLKKGGRTSLVIQTQAYQLDKSAIENSINGSLNETDWNVLNILLEDPVIPNKEIAKKAFMSVDGIGSSLRRMYNTFDIKESKYKKISLIMKAIKISNHSIS